MFVACVPHLDRCYHGGRENEPLRPLTKGRHVRDKARSCTGKAELPLRPASHRLPPATAMLSHSGMSDSLRPRRLQPASLPCVWDFPGKNTGVGCHFLLQGIVLTQRLNLSLLHLSPVLAGGFFTTSATWEALPASDWGPVQGRYGCPVDEAVLRQVTLSNMLRAALHFERLPSTPHLSLTRTRPVAQTGGPPNISPGPSSLFY